MVWKGSQRCSFPAFFVANAPSTTHLSQILVVASSCVLIRSLRAADKLMNTKSQSCIQMIFRCQLNWIFYCLGWSFFWHFWSDFFSGFFGPPGKHGAFAFSSLQDSEQKKDGAVSRYDLVFSSFFLSFSSFLSSFLFSFSSLLPFFLRFFLFYICERRSAGWAAKAKRKSGVFPALFCAGQKMLSLFYSPVDWLPKLALRRQPSPDLQRTEPSRRAPSRERCRMKSPKPKV